MRIIPAIDLKDGSCVRLYKGDFDKTQEYSKNPAEIAVRFNALDVKDLHVVDLDGARTGDGSNRDVVAEIIRATALDVQLGGGIRETRHINDWLAAGVRRCVIGSVAIENPALTSEWLTEFGGDKIVLALDVRLDGDGTPRLTSQGWTRDSELSLWDCIDRYGELGLSHVLCTDVSRDGAMLGPNFSLYAQALKRYPELKLQASGGVRHIEDLIALRDAGVPAAITGKAMLDGKITAEEIQSFQRNE